MARNLPGHAAKSAAKSCRARGQPASHESSQAQHSCQHHNRRQRQQLMPRPVCGGGAAAGSHAATARDADPCRARLHHRSRSQGRHPVERASRCAAAGHARERRRMHRSACCCASVPYHGAPVPGVQSRLQPRPLRPTPSRPPQHRWTEQREQGQGRDAPSCPATGDVCAAYALNHALRLRDRHHYEVCPPHRRGTQNNDGKVEHCGPSGVHPLACSGLWV